MPIAATTTSTAKVTMAPRATPLSWSAWTKRALPREGDLGEEAEHRDADREQLEQRDHEHPEGTDRRAAGLSRELRSLADAWRQCGSIEAGPTSHAGRAHQGAATVVRAARPRCEHASMCGRMTQQTPPEEVARIFDAEVRDHELEDAQPSWNVAPTDPITVVLQREDGRTVERPRWGLIPSWAKSAREGARLINARAETLATSPAFRVAFAKRRCIVPADGFYEWQHTGGKRKQPYLPGARR